MFPTCLGIRTFLSFVVNKEGVRSSANTSHHHITPQVGGDRRQSVGQASEIRPDKQNRAWAQTAANKEGWKRWEGVKGIGEVQYRPVSRRCGVPSDSQPRTWPGSQTKQDLGKGGASHRPLQGPLTADGKYSAYLIRVSEHMLMSTPTKLTHSCTTASRAAFRDVCDTSCCGGGGKEKTTSFSKQASPSPVYTPPQNVKVCQQQHCGINTQLLRFDIQWGLSNT